MANAALSPDLKVIDVDTHVIEPPDLWTSRVPSKLVDQVPRVEKYPQTERSHWRIGDEWATPPGHFGLAGWPYYPPPRPTEFDHIDPGGWQSDVRLKRMDEYGIFAQVLYPNLIGFDAPLFMKLGSELSILCTQVYNDFLIEFASADPKRLVPIAMVPFWDLEESVTEIKRAAATGHHGVLFANRFEQIGMPTFVDPYWDPVYEVLQDLDLSVNYHIGFTRTKSAIDSMNQYASKTPEEHARLTVLNSSEALLGNAETMRSLLTSNLCDRFPRLKFVSVESGFGYVPYLLESLDWHWKTTGAFRTLPTLPSEYFRRQCYGSFWFEQQTLRLLDLYPDNFMFETDYPHPTSLSPGPASPADIPIDHIRSTFENFEPGLTRKVLHDNAVAVYNL
jgi:uncharacterized protein